MKSILCFLAMLSTVSMAHGQEGTLIILNKSDHTASLLDLASRNIVATLPTGTAPHEVAVSPDGRIAVVANYGTGPQPGNSLTVLDLPGRKRVSDIDLGNFKRPHGIAWAGKNTVAVTVEANRALLVVDVVSGTIVRTVETDQNVSHMVVLSNDRSRAFVANIGSGSLTVIDLLQGERIRTIPTGAGAEGIDITPDGREVWVTNRSANTVSVIDAASLDIIATLESSSFPIRAKVTPDGRHMLVSNAQSGDVAVFDARTKKEVRRIKMEFSPVLDADQRLFGNQFGKSPVPVGILIDPSGTFAFIANTQADIVTMVDLQEWKVVDRLKAGREPDGMGFSLLKLAE